MANVAKDPFMTLVDAATARIEEKEKQQERLKKESLSILIPPKNCESASLGRGHDDYSSPPLPPLPHTEPKKTVPLVSPSTPKASNSTARVGARARRQSFAVSLMDLLLDETLGDIITFLPDGDAFAILEPKKFAEEIMPKTFGIKTYSPFVRKLHRWGFERLMDKKTHSVDVFRHPFFIRGNYVLCQKIKCVGRLVKSPIEDADDLSQTGATGNGGSTMPMSNHRNLLEVFNHGERMHVDAASHTHDERAAHEFLLDHAAFRLQEQEVRHQQSMLQEAQQLRQQQAARQLLQQQVAAERPSVNQMLLAALQNQSREEELIVLELQRIKNEERLHQQLQSEVNQLQHQARLQDLLSSRGRLGRVFPPPQDSGNAQMSALLQALDSKAAGGSSFESHLRHLL